MKVKISSQESLIPYPVRLRMIPKMAKVNKREGGEFEMLMSLSKVKRV